MEINLKASVPIQNWDASNDPLSERFHFAIDEATNDITLGGMIYAKDHFYLLDQKGKKVFAYTSDGVRKPSHDFALHHSNQNPEGLYFYKEKFYIGEVSSFKIFSYISDELGVVTHSPKSDIIFKYNHILERSNGYCDGINKERVPIGKCSNNVQNNYWEVF